jgi:hypothetical protein
VLDGVALPAPARILDRDATPAVFPKRVVRQIPAWRQRRSRRQPAGTNRYPQRALKLPAKRDTGPELHLQIHAQKLPQAGPQDGREEIGLNFEAVIGPLRVIHAVA